MNCCVRNGPHQGGVASGMIEMRRAQRSFGDGLIAEEVSDLRESWMTHADAVLADEAIVAAVYEALAKRHPKSRCRGRRGQARRFSAEIAQGVKRSSNALTQLALEGLRRELDEITSRVRRVMKQTRARIFRGNTRSEDKLLSLFEPSTEASARARRASPTSSARW
jgi:hypothetical protein